MLSSRYETVYFELLKNIKFQRTNFNAQISTVKQFLHFYIFEFFSERDAKGKKRHRKTRLLRLSMILILCTPIQRAWISVSETLLHHNVCYLVYLEEIFKKVHLKIVKQDCETLWQSIVQKTQKSFLTENYFLFFFRSKSWEPRKCN